MGRLAQPLSTDRADTVTVRNDEVGLGIAVALPVLDEEQVIEQALKSLFDQTEQALEIVVVDGGSTDRTLEIAERCGARVVMGGRRGRGFQIADAIRSLSDDVHVIVVAHADMTFPPTAIQVIRSALTENPACPGGCLGHRFDQQTLAMRTVEWFDRIRAQRTGMAYGDQAQFFRRDMLLSQGGFPDQPIMEDIELSRRLGALGRPVYLDLPVTVSARRFKRLGLLPTLRTNLRLRRAYRAGGLAACAELFETYYG